VSIVDGLFTLFTSIFFINSNQWVSLRWQGTFLAWRLSNFSSFVDEIRIIMYIRKNGENIERGKKSNGDATELDIGRQRIRTTAKSIRVSDCYSVVLIRHVSWTQWFWGGGYSAKKRSIDREIRIGLLIFDRDRAGSSTRTICFVRYVRCESTQKRKDETMVASI